MPRTRKIIKAAKHEIVGDALTPAEAGIAHGLVQARRDGFSLWQETRQSGFHAVLNGLRPFGEGGACRRVLGGGRVHLSGFSVGDIEIPQDSVLKDLNFMLGFFQQMLTMTEEFAAAPVGGDRRFKRQLLILHAADDFFEFAEGGFEFQIGNRRVFGVLRSAGFK